MTVRMLYLEIILEKNNNWLAETKCGETQNSFVLQKLEVSNSSCWDQTVNNSTTVNKLSRGGDADIVPEKQSYITAVRESDQ